MSKKLIAVSLVAFLVGCAGSTALIGKRRMVSSTPDKKPDWVGKSFFEKKDALHYVGGQSGRSDMALAIREARGEGEKQLAEQIKQKIRTEFGSAIEGQNMDNQTGYYVKDIIAKVSDNVEVSGVKQLETYVEKYEENAAGGVRYVFDAYALIQLDRADYLQARKRAMDGALNEVKRAQNGKAEEALKKAFDKLEGTGTAQ